MVCNANLHDRAPVVVAVWSLKVSWSSKFTPRFLADLDGIVVDDFSCMVKLCCTLRLAGRQESLSLLGRAAGVILSPMPRCLLGRYHGIV